jgi:hypothetical protein
MSPGPDESTNGGTGWEQDAAYEILRGRTSSLSAPAKVELLVKFQRKAVLLLFLEPDAGVNEFFAKLRGATKKQMNAGYSAQMILQLERLFLAEEIYRSSHAGAHSALVAADADVKFLLETVAGARLKADQVTEASFVGLLEGDPTFININKSASLDSNNTKNRGHGPEEFTFE